MINQQPTPYQLLQTQLTEHSLHFRIDMTKTNRNTKQATTLAQRILNYSHKQTANNNNNGSRDEMPNRKHNLNKADGGEHGIGQTSP
jgi:hypothetical protein